MTVEVLRDGLIRPVDVTISGSVTYVARSEGEVSGVIYLTEERGILYIDPDGTLCLNVNALKKADQKAKALKLIKKGALDKDYLKSELKNHRKFVSFQIFNIRHHFHLIAFRMPHSHHRLLPDLRKFLATIIGSSNSFRSVNLVSN